jgi:cob(I)alamin adenosyltransferase
VPFLQRGKEVKKNGELRLQNLASLRTDIELLENEIDAMEEALPPMTHFVYLVVIPLCHCHIARCVCRRAERLAVHLRVITNPLLKSQWYLNRLSDYLFVGTKVVYDLKRMKFNGFLSNSIQLAVCSLSLQFYTDH